MTENLLKKRTGPLGSSPENAVPLGRTVKTKIERGDRYSSPEIYNLEITVLEVARGTEAWNKMDMENTPGSGFKQGFELFLALIRFGYFSKGRGFGHGHEPYEIKEGSFVAVSVGGEKEYEAPSFPKQPHPKLLEVPILPGSTIEGWIALQFQKEANEHLMIFKREYSVNTYGVWAPVWFRF